MAAGSANPANSNVAVGLANWLGHLPRQVWEQVARPGPGRAGDQVSTATANSNVAVGVGVWVRCQLQRCGWCLRWPANTNSNVAVGIGVAGQLQRCGWLRGRRAPPTPTLRLVLAWAVQPQRWR